MVITWFLKGNQGEKASHFLSKDVDFASLSLVKRFSALLLSFVITVSPVFFSCMSSAQGGELDKFEKKVEKKEEPSENSSSNVAEDVWWDMLFDFLMSGLIMSDDMEGRSLKEYKQELRESGSPAMPTFKLEGNYHYVLDSIHGYDVTATAGYLIIGVECNLWHLFERAPDDQLKFLSPHLLIRMVPFEVMEIDFALGSKSILGNNTYHGVEAGFPAYFFFGKFITLDLKPYLSYINGHDLWDLSAGISFRYKFLGIRGGYRLIENDGDYIHGPQVGLSIQW